MLQGKLDQPLSEPASPRKRDVQDVNVDNLSVNVNVLRDEVVRLRKQLITTQQERKLMFVDVFFSKKLQIDYQWNFARIKELVANFLSKPHPTTKFDDQFDHIALTTKFNAFF